MKSLFRRVLPALFLAAFTSSGLAGEKLESIFNGKDFDGWDIRGQAVYTVNDGVITGVTGKGGHGWLCTKKTYGDFILELEVKIKGGNSGIQIRSHIDPKDEMVGYQIEVDPSPRAWSGGLYEQGRRGWLHSLNNGEPAHTAFKLGEWNHYRIECRGDSIKSWVNGQAAADYVDSMDIEGVIALQVHSGSNAHVEFRNVRLQDLGRRSWQRIWDGQTLQGWHIIGKGEWTIQDGTILGRHAAGEPEFGHLVTDKVYGDFTVRLKYRAVTGNSGFYFRIEETGNSGVSGFQAEIDPQKDSGGLYETNGRTWVSQPTPEQVKTWYKPGDWNTMTISAHGRRIVVNVNGHKTAELKNDPGRTQGRLALQLHGGQDCEIAFKDIEVLSETSR